MNGDPDGHGPSTGTAPSAATLAKWSASRHADCNLNPSRNELIAIVDDDRWAREGMWCFVESLGYLGAMFASAEEYMQSELKQCAKCLILDVHLPGMSGPDLQARLLHDGYLTPVIVVTGEFERHVRDRVIKAGAFAYLTKPCDEGTLIDCLESAVCKQRTSAIEAGT